MQIRVTMSSERDAKRIAENIDFLSKKATGERKGVVLVGVDGKLVVFKVPKGWYVDFYEAPSDEVYNHVQVVYPSKDSHGKPIFLTFMYFDGAKAITSYSS